MKAIMLPNDEKTPTENVMSAMRKIEGAPIFFHMARLLRDAGVKELFICDNSSSDEIKSYLSKNLRRLSGMKVRFLRVTPNAKSATIVSLCEKYIVENAFFVVPNDVITDLELKKVLSHHKENGRVATVCIAENKSLASSFDENLKYETKIFNSGIYVFEDDIFGYVNGNRTLDGDVLIRVAQDDELTIYSDGAVVKKCEAPVGESVNF